MSSRIRQALKVNWKILYESDQAICSATHTALKAFDKGEATQDQQKLVRAAFRDMLCRWETLSITDDERETAALEGRRSVWEQYLWAVRNPLKTLTGEQDGGN